MKIESLDGPQIAQPPAGAAIERTNISARDKAIAKLLEAAKPVNAQAEVVQDPTHVSPEEMGAIQAPETKQINTSESVETPSVSTDSVESPQAVEKEAKLSSQYANLARREKALRFKEQQLKAREEAFRSPEPKAPPVDLSRYVDRDSLMKDPFSVLNDLGLSYEQLTNLALNQPKPEDVAQRKAFEGLQNDIKTLREEQQKVKQAYEDTQVQARSQALKQIERDVKNLVVTNEAYETIRETNSMKEVVDLIERTFDQDGILLDIEDAAREVENYLVEEALKLSKLKKIQQRLQLKEPASSKAQTAQKPEKSQQPSQQQNLKTLTNSVGTSRQLNARERAILAMKGELK